MTWNPGRLILALCLLTVGGGIVANAQVGSVPQIEANVPFAFMVGDTRLPAGKYQIKTIDDTENDVLEIRSDDSRTAVLFDTSVAQTRDDQRASRTELVFDKVGDRYFLTQIWVEGTSSGNELIKSRMEKRLTDGVSSQPEKHSVVAIMKRMKL